MNIFLTTINVLVKKKKTPNSTENHMIIYFEGDPSVSHRFQSSLLIVPLTLVRFIRGKPRGKLNKKNRLTNLFNHNS